MWPQWWSFADVTQQGVDFSKKISKIKIFFWFDFHRCLHGPSKIRRHFKGQLILKWFFEVVDFLQKTNENKSHTSKKELFRSFFGGNRWPHKPFRNQLTFRSKSRSILKLSKNVFYKKCGQKDSNDFWRRKLTLKVRFRRCEHLWKSNQKIIFSFTNFFC